MSASRAALVGAGAYGIVVTLREPEGPTTFHWVLGRR